MNVSVVSIIAVSMVISSSDVSVLGVAMVSISVVSVAIAMMSIAIASVIAVSTEAIAGGVVTIELVGSASEAISVTISVVTVMSVVTMVSMGNLDESMLTTVVAMLGAIDGMDRWDVLIGVDVITRILRAVLNSIN